MTSEVRLSALREILGNVDPKRIEAITLSTTLTTNALLEEKATGRVIVSSGPGVDPAYHRIGDAYFVVDGSIDHRGEDASPSTGSSLKRLWRAVESRG